MSVTVISRGLSWLRTLPIRSRRGFALMEIALVLVIGLAIIVSGLTYFNKLRDDQQYVEMDQQYMGFVSNVEAAIRKKFTGPTANRNGAFNKEIVQMLEQVYAYQPNTTIDTTAGSWNYTVNGAQYHLFIYPYPGITRFFTTAAECRKFRSRLQQSFILTMPHISISDRCSTSDRRGIGIRYERFTPN